MTKYDVVRNSGDAVISARTVVQAIGAVRAHGMAESELTEEEHHAYTVALVLLTEHMKDPLVQMGSTGLDGEVPLTKPPPSA